MPFDLDSGKRLRPPRRRIYPSLDFHNSRPSKISPGTIMRFKVTGDHRKVLEKQKFIEFEDVFTLDEIETASKHVDIVLGKRAKQLIDTQSCEQLYHEGRDLWRDDPVLENFICNRGLAQLTAQLFQQKSLY